MLIFAETVFDMTREEAIEKLAPFIPSLKREYNRWGELRDKNKDRSWLYRDESYRKPSAKWDDPDRERYLPEVIPENFLEGTVADIDGEKFYVKRSYPSIERDYRRVYLEIMDFAMYGNTHKYGKLQIDGLSWSRIGPNSRTASFKLDDVEPRVKGIWDVDLLRIVAEGEMGGGECPPGEATGRFVYLDELFATAAYVTLLRIQGPCVLDNASSYATVRTEKDILLRVAENDEVTFGPKLKKVLQMK